jgi:hypothetical protein
MTYLWFIDDAELQIEPKEKSASIDFGEIRPTSLREAGLVGPA